MKIERFTIKDVDHNTGNVKDGGSVVTNGYIRMSVGEGCGMKGCHCSDGYWLSIGEPAKIILPENEFGAIVEGIRVKFDNEEEMDIFLHDHEILGAD